MIHVIGDIHGCINTLNALLDRINYCKDDTLIFIGDYIDRGKNSYEVVKKVQELQLDNENVIALRGNHEQMLLDWFFSEYQYDKEYAWKLWKYNGGMETVKSFRQNNITIEDEIEWFRSLKVYYEDDYNFYVHAGIGKSNDVKNMDLNDFIWSREFNPGTLINKNVVFGHTPLNNPYFDNNKKLIGVDTGCVFGFNLTCAQFDRNYNLLGFIQQKFID